MSPLRIEADLDIEHEGLRVHLANDGGDLVLRLDGTPPRALGRGRRSGPWPGVFDELARRDLRVVLVDGSGQRLGEAGAGVRSPLGWLLTGTAHLRPTVALLRWARS